MPYCAILQCKNDSRSCNLAKGGISYHRQEDFLIKKSGNRFLLSNVIPTQNILYRRLEPKTPLKEVDINLEPASRKDVTCNVMSGLGPSTPRKRKLEAIITWKDRTLKQQKLKIKRLQDQNRRFRKRINKIEDVLKAVQEKFTMQHKDLVAFKNTNVQVQELIARHVINQKSKGITKQKYSPALRSFAMTLHYYSPKAYNYVRNTFNTCLPHPRTLKKWYESIGGEPGFTKEFFIALKVNSKSYDHPLICGLIIDEMAIRRHIEWDGRKFHGYVNIGANLDDDCLPEAKEALVFLVTVINGNWKVPVG